MRYRAQDAVRGEYVEETKLLLDKGGKIHENGKARPQHGLHSIGTQCHVCWSADLLFM